MPFDGQDFTPSSQCGTEEPVWQAIVEKLRRWVSLGAKQTRAPYDLVQLGQPQPLETLQLLAVARALVSEKKHWAQGRYETLGGRRCAVGALCVAAEILARGSSEEASRHLLSVARERGYAEVEAMNDDSTHADILSAFDDAIARATRCLLAHG